MKQLTVLNTTIALAVLFTAFSCSGDVEPTSSCFPEENRKIIETVSNITATILGPETQDCPRDFIIEPDSDLPNNVLGLLSPCNLEESFQTNGLSVQVSGFIYESFETEDICADFFEITEISVMPKKAPE
ncbi:hypothetical protein [Tunicatimonas pelagia]|uniref:hypothetical protein n=1 Tax=Tunicatimonas pelagia TaxID=931531 RepID=UPI002665EA63|nr:hypothetical protein [Tunicatimonas pelagia]WKN45906.1 hypothetical protein P0M28_13155 [Tunicatimonas pelagia]